CTQYKTCVISTGRTEPTDEDVETFLSSISECINGINNYKSSDSNYTKLLMCQQFQNIIYSNSVISNNFEILGIDESVLLEMMDLIYDETYKVSTKNNDDMKQKILSNCEKYSKSIQESYANYSERNN
ncbi:MAG: hypothetical protein LIO62_01530, partial [Clostridiales bacterium]|nr:hypothetical protein [Clostridiales bacterium]